MPAKILIIEDDPISRKVLKVKLEKRGYDLYMATTGEEGLEILEKFKIPVSIVDWQLPGIDGIEVCKRIRANEALLHTYIIFHTSKDEKKDLINALNSGADDYIIKPFDIDELEARIKVGLRVVGLEEKLKIEQKITMNYANQMEKLARERAEQLVHADRMASLGILSAGVAHEINNPTSFISGNAQTLERFWPTIKTALETHAQDEAEHETCVFIAQETPQILKGIRNGAERISRIVSGLKTFSHQDNKPHQEECDVNAVVETALELCHNALKYHVKVDKRLDPELPKIMGDGQQIGQVLVNLFINAADAMSEKNGQLWVSTAREGQNIRIMIEDNGPGIHEKVIKKIWDPFFTTKPIGKGTGLGLSISQGIIEAHKGAISVTNRPEGGASFRIQLPVASAPAPAGQSDRTKTSEERAHGQ